MRRNQVFRRTKSKFWVFLNSGNTSQFTSAEAACTSDTVDADATHHHTASRDSNQERRMLDQLPCPNMSLNSLLELRTRNVDSYEDGTRFENYLTFIKSEFRIMA